MAAVTRLGQLRSIPCDVLGHSRDRYSGPGPANADLSVGTELCPKRSARSRRRSLDVHRFYRPDGDLRDELPLRCRLRLRRALPLSGARLLAHVAEALSRSAVSSPSDAAAIVTPRTLAMSWSSCHLAPRLVSRNFGAHASSTAEWESIPAAAAGTTSRMRGSLRSGSSLVLNSVEQ